MRKIAILIAIPALLLSAGGVSAQTEGFGKIGDRLRDVLGDVLGRGEQKVHGSIVYLKDNTVTLRADDGQTYTVDAAAVDPKVRESLALGQGVTIVGKPGAKSYQLIASDVRPDAGGQAVKPYKKAHGVVQSVSGSTVTFRTDEGRLMSVDASQIKGQQPSLKMGDAVTLVYEQGTGRKLIARWLEPDQAATAAAADAGDPVSFHGYVLNVSDTHAAVRADDGWTHVVDVAQLGADARRLQRGEGVTITAVPRDNVLTVTEVRRDSADPARKGQVSKKLQTLHGTVQSISGSTLTFRTDEGRLVPVDVSQIKGSVPKPKVNDPVTLVYEPGAKGKLTALWMEPDAVQPAASVPTARSERVHGWVDSLDGSKFWLRTDDDRWFLVDTARLDAATRRSLQPGKMLTVVGRMPTADSNELTAESVRLD